MRSTAPGGAAVSNLKKRRLAALSQAYKTQDSKKAAAAAGGANSTARLAGRGDAAAAGSKAGSQEQPGQAMSAAQQEPPPPAAFPYLPLPCELLHGPLGRALGLQAEGSHVRVAAMGTSAGHPPPGAAPSVEQLLQGLLSRGKQGALGRNTGEIVAERVVDKVLMLDNSSGRHLLGALNKPPLQQYSRQLARGAARKEQWRAAAQAASYRALAQVHSVWRRYAQQQLGANPMGCEARLLQMELRGALVRVARCKQAQLQGVEGFVFHTSRTTLHVVSADNRRHCIPLCSTVFKIVLGEQHEAVVAGQNLVRSWDKKAPLPVQM